MKYLGKVQEGKDLVNVDYVSEVDTQIREDLSPLIEDATEVVISGTEPTGKNRRAIWVDTSASGSDDSSKEIVVSPTLPETFTAWIDTSTTYTDNGTAISIIDGGTGARNADDARRNLKALRKAKLLWSGSATPGTTLNITGIGDYLILIGNYDVYSSLSPSLIFNFVSGKSSGAATFATVIDSGTRYNRIVSGNFTINANSIKVEDIFTTVTYGSSVFVEGDSSNYPLKELYGLVLKSEAEGW